MNSAKLVRNLSLVTLVLWSAVLLYIYFSGRVMAFLHPNFRPGVLIAGLVLAALAAVSCWLGSGEDGCHDSSCCDDDDHSHTHESDTLTSKLAAFVILVVPVVSAVAVSPDHFSLAVLQNRLSIEHADMLGTDRVTYVDDEIFDIPQGDFFLENDAGYTMVEVVDLFFAVSDDYLQRELEGKKIEFVGQVMPLDASAGISEGFYAARMFMMCCAADARPLTVACAHSGEVREGGWVRVRGQVEFGVRNGQVNAVVRVESVDPTEVPREVMLF